MADPKIVDHIVEIVRRVARIGPEIVVNAESHLIDDLQIDSLDLFGIFVEVDDTFRVNLDGLDSAELAELHRIGDFAACVARLRPKLERDCVDSSAV